MTTAGLWVLLGTGAWRATEPTDAAPTDAAPLDLPGCPAHVDGAPAGLLIRVEKSAWRLAVYRSGERVVGPDGKGCFPIALGAAPSGDKQAQGDEHTPEGVFRVTHKNPNSAFHLSLGLNYPTQRHAQAAYAAGRISAATRDRVIAADQPGRMPARDTALGGDIYIHGGGTTWPYWTDGCVALDDVVIEWLYALAEPGTVVWVLP